MGLARFLLFFFSMILSLTPLLSLTYGSDRLVVADFSAGADKKGIPKGWHLHERSGKADLSIVRHGDIHAIRLRSADSSFALQKGVDVNPSLFPNISWRWMVTKLPEGGDFRKSASDDQAAQLFLAFSNRNGIVYLWDTTAPEGASGDAWAPPFMKIKAIVVRSGHGEAGKWIAEKRNVMEDYRSLYGHEPPLLAGIRIQINSQHTESSGESFFADVAFERQ